MAFKPMRSCHPDEKFGIALPKLGSYKLDGIRLCRYGDKLLTKSGKQLPNKHIRHWCLINIPEGVDFEVISGPPNLETTYNTTYRAAMTIEGEPDFTCYCFDLCDKEGRESSFAIDRLEALRQKLAHVTSQWPDRVVVVEQVLLKSHEEIQAFYAKALQDGYEGVILKDPTGFYKWGKCTAKEQTQLKLKPEVDAEAIITGFYEAMENTNEAFTNEVGETKRSTHQENLVGKNTLGGFFATDVATGQQVRVPCGKMKHDERKHVWDNQALYLGRPFTYRSMGYGVKDLPRHLRWYRWRDSVDMEANSAEA